MKRCFLVSGLALALSFVAPLPWADATAPDCSTNIKLEYHTTPELTTIVQERTSDGQWHAVLPSTSLELVANSGTLTLVAAPNVDIRSITTSQAAGLDTLYPGLAPTPGRAQRVELDPGTFDSVVACAQYDPSASVGSTDHPVLVQMSRTIRVSRLAILLIMGIGAFVLLAPVGAGRTRSHPK